MKQFKIISIKSKVILIDQNNFTFSHVYSKMKV